MNYMDIVQKVATELGYMTPEGKLDLLDSISVVDFMTELENKAKIKIPPPQATPEHFQTLETVAQFLTMLHGRAK